MSCPSAGRIKKPKLLSGQMTPQDTRMGDTSGRETSQTQLSWPAQGTRSQIANTQDLRLPHPGKSNRILLWFWSSTFTYAFPYDHPRNWSHSFRKVPMCILGGMPGRRTASAPEMDTRCLHTKGAISLPGHWWFQWMSTARHKLSNENTNTGQHATVSTQKERKYVSDISLLSCCGGMKMIYTKNQPKYQNQK